MLTRLKNAVTDLEERASRLAEGGEVMADGGDGEFPSILKVCFGEADPIVLSASGRLVVLRVPSMPSAQPFTAIASVLANWSQIFRIVHDAGQFRFPSRSSL